MYARATEAVASGRKATFSSPGSSKVYISFSGRISRNPRNNSIVFLPRFTDSFFSSGFFSKGFLGKGFFFKGIHKDLMNQFKNDRLEPQTHLRGKEATRESRHVLPY